MSEESAKLFNLPIISKLSIGTFLAMILAMAVVLSQRNLPTDRIHAVIYNHIYDGLTLNLDNDVYSY